MVNFYLDTEFHEYHKQPKCLGFNIGKPIPTIDLISIGIVVENGDEYYAISKDFHKKELDLLRAYYKKLKTNKNLKHLTFLKEYYGNQDR